MVQSTTYVTTNSNDFEKDEHTGMAGIIKSRPVTEIYEILKIYSRKIIRTSLFVNKFDVIEELNIEDREKRSGQYQVVVVS